MTENWTTSEPRSKAWTEAWRDMKGRRVVVIDEDINVRVGTVRAIREGRPAMSIMTDDGGLLSEHPQYVWPLIETHKDHDHESQTSTPLEGSTCYHCDAVYQSGSWRT